MQARVPSSRCSLETVKIEKNYFEVNISLYHGGRSHLPIREQLEQESAPGEHLICKRGRLINKRLNFHLNDIFILVETNIVGALQYVNFR